MTFLAGLGADDPPMLDAGPFTGYVNPNAVPLTPSSPTVCTITPAWNRRFIALGVGALVGFLIAGRRR